MTAAGEVMALDWGITLQCDTTGKEDASSVGSAKSLLYIRYYRKQMAQRKTYFHVKWKE